MQDRIDFFANVEQCRTHLASFFDAYEFSSGHAQSPFPYRLYIKILRKSTLLKSRHRMLALGFFVFITLQRHIATFCMALFAAQAGAAERFPLCQYEVRHLVRRSGNMKIPRIAQENGMSAIFDELSNMALALSPLERARLADLMIESLDAAPLTEVDQAWIDLAQRRAEEIRAGTAETFSAEEVLSEARGAIVW